MTKHTLSISTAALAIAAASGFALHAALAAPAGAIGALAGGVSTTGIKVVDQRLEYLARTCGGTPAVCVTGGSTSGPEP